MELRKLSFRVESGETVVALYARDLLSTPDALHLKLGDLHLAGRPAALVDMLSRALRECYRAWGDGKQAGLDDGPGGAGASGQVVSLPPVTGQAEVGDALSRLAPWATAKPLGLDGGAVISDALASAGGGKEDVFRMERGGDV